MESGSLSEDVRALLRDHIESFEQLEILLLLARHADQDWTPVSVSNELKISSEMAAEALAHLCRSTLLDTHAKDSARFRYRPGTLDQTVKALAAACSERRIEVMMLLNRNAVERVRTSGMRLFADAFLIRGKKKDG